MLPRSWRATPHTLDGAEPSSVLRKAGNQGCYGARHQRTALDWRRRAMLLLRLSWHSSGSLSRQPSTRSLSLP